MTFEQWMHSVLERVETALGHYLPEPAVEPAIADYSDQNRKSWLRQWNLQMDMPYELVPHATVEALLFGKNGGRWAGFQKSYPQSDGWISLSAVGFNSDRTIAVVCVTHHFESNGSTELKVLRYEDGKWKPLGNLGCGWAWSA